MVEYRYNQSNYIYNDSDKTRRPGNKEFEKTQRIKQYRTEVSKKVSMANKRIQRLEGNQLKDTPAYQTYLKGGGKFSIKGKTYNEVQAELSRINKFLDSTTSTVRGTNAMLKEMAKNTGMKYSNLKDLKAKSAKFFELASKVEQYLRNVHDMASAIGYQKIWEVINVYTKDANINLADGKANIDDMIESVGKAIAEYEDPIKAQINEINKSFNWVPIKD